jgi:hypothetical protein
LRSFLFGVAAHSILYVIYGWFGAQYGYTDVVGGAAQIQLVSFMDEIFWSIPLALAMSIVWLYAVKNRLLARFLNAIGATRRYGDEDVWSFTFNSGQPHVEYVHVRDLTSGMTFAGWVNTYFENEPIRELLLKDAILYNEAGEAVSESPHLYIARDKTNIWIDFPYREKGDADGNQGSTSAPAKQIEPGTVVKGGKI